MKQITGYVTDYFRHIHKLHFVATSLILSILIWVNYKFGLNDFLKLHPSFIVKFSRYYLLFASVFVATFISGFLFAGKNLPKSFYFYILLLAAPAIFSLKVSIQVSDVINLNNSYLNVVLQWPLKALVTVILVYIFWNIDKNPKPLAGLSAKNFDSKPYFTLLLFMLPLLLIAGLGEDFQRVYPKLQMIHSSHGLLHKVFFEIFYGLDFFTIELFFRGFLILTFIKYAGKDTVLPMAVFYCTIHFGKPVAECISSYFGGLILGAVVNNTRSIWGGLIVHLGIAWLMELIGVLY